MNPTFFRTPEDLRGWFQTNHETTAELWLGFHKRGSGKPSVTWPEAVDQALCFGWIDGVRKSLGETSYVIRFTPRKPRGTWSLVNIRRMEELLRNGLVFPGGVRAYEARQEKRSGIYAYEQRQEDQQLSPAYAALFQAEAAAWAYFQRQPPSYQRTASFWVMSAKQESTQQRRLATLIADSAAGRTIARLTRPSKARGTRSV